MEELLQVKDLSISFHTYNGEVQAVRNASFDLHRKEVLAIVGESGSGKSVTMQTVLKLTPCELKSGQIIFDGKCMMIRHWKNTAAVTSREALPSRDTKVLERWMPSSFGRQP